MPRTFRELLGLACPCNVEDDEWEVDPLVKRIEVLEESVRLLAQLELDSVLKIQEDEDNNPPMRIWWWKNKYFV